MDQPEPDYSLYNLEQLYDIYRNIDKERYPQRTASVRQQIVLKQGSLPQARNHPPSLLLRWMGATPSRKNYRPTKALRAARVIVELEYGAFVFFLVLPSIFLVGGDFLISFVIWSVIYLLFFGGVAILRKCLRSIKDECSVELWSLIALGIAPFSAILYTFIAAYAMAQLSSYDIALALALYLVPFVGFYTPFILAVFWVKYHCREDEF